MTSLYKNSAFKSKTGAGHRVGSRFRFIALFAVLLSGCSILASRPVQDMNDTAAALKGAKEVQADTLAPELYRQATEWFQKARVEYKYKNFKEAREYARKARYYAELAEFEVVRSPSSSRSETLADPLADSVKNPAPPPEPASTPAPAHTPYEYPSAQGTAADPTFGGAVAATPTPTPIAVPTP